MHLTLKKMWGSRDPGHAPFSKNSYRIISGLILKYVRQICSV